MLLVLDLDETLVYAAEDPLERAAELRVGPFHVYKRPGVDAFLAGSLERFDVGVWTSSSESYAEDLVRRLLPEPGRLAFVWSRARCVRRFDPDLQEYFWIKDLKKLKRRGWPLERILMVDDTPRKLSRNYGNHLLVREWKGDPSDRELDLLLPYLETLRDVENVRRVDKSGWRSESKA